MILMLRPLFEETLSLEISPKIYVACYPKIFISPNTSIRARVLGKRVNRGYDLQIPVYFFSQGYVKGIE